MGKHGIFDATFQQIILISQTLAPDLVSPLKDLRSIHSKFFSELQTSASNVYKSSERAKNRYSNEMALLQKKYDETDTLILRRIFQMFLKIYFYTLHQLIHNYPLLIKGCVFCRFD